MLRAPGFYGIEAASGDMETRGLAQGEPTLRLELPDGATVDLENDDIERRGPKDLAWRGWIAGDDDSEAVLTLKNGLIFGRLRSGTDVYELRSRKNGRLRVEKIDPAMMPDCDTDSHLHARDGGGLDTGGTAGDTALASAGDGSVVIDLLAVYSNDARDGAGGVAEIEALIQAAVDAANAAFINSDMTARYRLVHVAHVDHDTWGTTGDDLDWVTDSSEVADLRDQYGADMVSILVDTPNSCGTAWVQRNPGPGFEDNAFQATDIDCAVGNLTFAHEHGHNLGFEHNIENSGASRDEASYGWSFGRYVDGSHRSVMSYSNTCTDGCTRVAYFSNPDIPYGGAATGVDGESDNARTGDMTGPVAAGYRVSVVTPEETTSFAVIGDFGSDDADGDEQDVADLVAGWSPEFVITMGDNRYGSISMDRAVGKYYCDFLTDAGNGANCARGNAATNAFFPSLGNHDYTDNDGLGEYLDYFTLPGTGVETSDTSGSERYYDFVKGPVHFFVLDSEAAGNSSSDRNAQQTWLQQRLSASTTPWQVVYFHHAPYSSGQHGPSDFMQWPFSGWGADVVMSGHDHTYERLQINGIPYFVNGLGGKSRYSFGTPIAGSEVRYRDNYGAMIVDATDTTMTFQFINVAGTVIDTHMIQTVPGSEGVLDVRIAGGNDDAEESLADGSMYLNSSDLEFGFDDYSQVSSEQVIGLRFLNVELPQGATITSAYLQFTVDETGSAVTDADIRAEAANSAAGFTSSSYNVTQRPTTGSVVHWSIPAWNSVGQSQQSPDISTLVQEVVDRGGWQPGGNMVFIIDSSGDRTAEAYNGVPASAPLLHVEYDTEPPPPNQAPTAGFASSTSGLTADFTDFSTDSDGTITSWAWDFGDGTGSDSQNPSHTYAAAGTYTVTLTVADDADATGSTSRTVTVTAPNVAPTAAFTTATPGLTAHLTDFSTDSDGTITSWAWDFGDGTGSDSQNPNHTYAAAGTYTVTLTVTDDDDATGSTSRTVTVVDNTPPTIPTDLAVTGTTTQRVSLGWNASTDNVAVVNYRVYRDGTQAGTANGTTFTDTGLTAMTTYLYEVSAVDPSGNESDRTVQVNATTDTLPADTITVLEAAYRASRDRMRVRATSSEQPEADLTVYGPGNLHLGQMTFKKGMYELKLRPTPDPTPWEVTIISSFGGTLTVPVTGAPPPPTPGQANGPIPADGEIHVSTAPMLRWVSGGNTTTFRVHFGASPEPPQVSSQAGTDYAPPTLAESTTYYWRVDSVNAYGTTRGQEWRFTTAPPPGPPGPATNPSPADGVSNVSITAQPGWNAAFDADTYDVYFGSAPTPTFVRNVRTTSFDPGPLAYDSVYVWRIDAVNDIGTTTGQTWQFKTQPAVPADSVNITIARWNEGKQELKVEATSSAQPDAVLTLQGFGNMTFKKNKYIYKEKPVAYPGTVTVTSDLGGSATATVKIR